MGSEMCIRDSRNAPDMLEAITAIVSRHPVQQRELHKAVADCFPGEAQKADDILSGLFASGRFGLVEHNGEPYWVIQKGENSGFTS